MRKKSFTNWRHMLLAVGLAGTLFLQTGYVTAAAEGNRTLKAADAADEVEEELPAALHVSAPEESETDVADGSIRAETDTAAGQAADTAAGSDDPSVSPETVREQEQESLAFRQTTKESAETDGEESLHADEPETSEEEVEEEDEEDMTPEEQTGEEVAEAIREIIEASSQMVYADLDGVERLQEYIDETQEAYAALSAEEQEALSESYTCLGHAANSVDLMQEAMEQMETTGTIVMEQTDRENSWRYIDGVPVREALEIVQEETAEVIEAAPNEALLTGMMTEPGSAARVILVDNNAVRKGIDVSKYQGIIDWKAVKEGGIEYAIIRCGYGNDYSSQDDEMWARNVTACEELGIPYGVYLYSHATTEAEVDSEVAHTLRLLAGHNPQLPVYMDIEENKQFLLGNAKLSKLADRYCSKIMAAGYKAGVYSSTYYWNNYLSLFAKNDNYFHWVAQWNDTGCTYGGRYEMWQYGIEDDVKGVSGEVDVDRWYGALPEPSAKAPVPKPVTDSEPHVEYRSHVQSFGWEGSWTKDGDTSGTVGQSKRLEGIQIQITNDDRLGVQYRTHVQTYGWENGWKSDGDVSGTVGQSKRLEAIQIRLTGADADKYDIYYCVHAQHFGWLNWAKNGESAGTAGYSYRLEGIQIRIVKKGAAAPADLGSNGAAFLQPLIRYRTHVQTYGWQGWQNDGALAGTTGQSKRLEGIYIELVNQPYSGGIEYRTHIQTYGWESGWKTSGQMSGTSGQSKRLEAIQIRLTGEMADKYDIYYQTHIQHFGWSGWAKNGEQCGSAGYAYRLEGIRIQLVPKGSAAPGSTANTFHQK